MKHFDILIIGFGKAGKTLAAKAAAMGKKVALIEKSSKMYGGTCINVGCIPTKRLITLSKEAKFHSDKKQFFKEAMSKKGALITTLRAKNYAMLEKNVEIFTDTATFVDEKSVILKSSGERLSGDFIVINTGSIGVTPKFSINSNFVYQSDEILNLNELPNELVIIGGGFIGLEMASMFANFGSKVTLLSRSGFLKDDDDDVRKAVLESLQAQGVSFIENAKIEKIDAKTLFFNDTSINADAFLLSLGRVANVADLSLQNAKILLNERGGVATDDTLKTSQSHIFAVGDVRGEEFFTYISLDDFRIVYSQIFGDKTRTKQNRSPYAKVLFTDTPLAKIGLNEREAKALGKDIKVLKLPTQNVPNAKILGNDTGFLKAICDAKSGEILGAAFYCVNSSEIINEIALAMKFRATASDLATQIFTHPSISEALNDLFLQF
ncbi:dihydrolipoyl dehydrogenase family protein [Campylobacter mucosalis]|uniref:dihydrolipoyl dehydrogenase family protein n=1 Tax=Campylobacter mucosalis TaxID=202 RepID=UPI00146FCE8D|nr:FAD-dependent oxidoreductase [Campylobacter mucosalis]